MFCSGGYNVEIGYLWRWSYLKIPDGTWPIKVKYSVRQNSKQWRLMGFFYEMSKLRYNKSGQCQILQKLRHRFWGKWYSRRGSCPCSHNRKWWGLSPDKYKFCKWWQFIDLACMLRYCGNHIHSICNIQLFLNRIHGMFLKGKMLGWDLVGDFSFVCQILSIDYKN